MRRSRQQHHVFRQVPQKGVRCNLVLAPLPTHNTKCVMRFYSISSLWSQRRHHCLDMLSPLWLSCLFVVSSLSPFLDLFSPSLWATRLHSWPSSLLTLPGWLHPIPSFQLLPHTNETQIYSSKSDISPEYQTL